MKNQDIEENFLNYRRYYQPQQYQQDHNENESTANHNLTTHGDDLHMTTEDFKIKKPKK